MLRQNGENYRGYAIAAAPGTHQAIVDLIDSTILRDARILDLGSFTGALLARLRDRGYENVFAADLADHLRERDMRFTCCDFNADFSLSFSAEKFDCIIACEVIEHIDDPRHFLKQCRNLLTESGTIFVSTPNIAFFEGRIKFFLKGELWGFGAKNYVGQRHITPISQEQFPILFDECGFRQSTMSTAGSFATPLRKALTAPLWILMRLLFGKRVVGETLICSARAKAGSDLKVTSDDLWGARDHPSSDVS